MADLAKMHCLRDASRLGVCVFGLRAACFQCAAPGSFESIAIVRVYGDVGFGSDPMLKTRSGLLTRSGEHESILFFFRFLLRYANKSSLPAQCFP